MSALTKQQQLIQLQQALKTAIACTLGTFVVNLLHLPLGFLVLIASFILLIIYPSQVFYKGLERIAGPLIATFFSLLVIKSTTSDLLQLSTLCIMLFIGGYLFTIQKYPYAALLGSVVGAIVLNQNITVSYKAAVKLGNDFVLCTIIGCVIAWAIQYFLWHGDKDKELSSTLGDLFLAAAKLQQNSQTISPADFIQLKTILMSGHFNHFDNKIIAYNQLIAISKSIFLKINNLNETSIALSKTNLYSLVKADLDEINTTLSQYLSIVGHCLCQQKMINEDFSGLQTLINNSANKLEQIRTTVLAKNNHDENLMLFETLYLLRELSVDLIDCSNTYNQILQNSFIKPSRNLPPKPTTQPWTLNVFATKQGIKLMLAVVLMFVINNYFSLNSGIQSIITCVILVVQPNIGRGERRGWLRFLGVIFGGIIGLIALITLEVSPHFTLLLLWIFVSMLICAYIALGPERKAYAGLQAGIMIALILLVDLQPPTSMTLALQRFFGVMLGFVIAEIIERFVWPVYPIKQLKSAMTNIVSITQNFFQILVFDKNNHATERVDNINFEDSWATEKQLLIDTQDVIGNQKISNSNYAQIALKFDKIYTELSALNANNFLQDTTLNAIQPLLQPIYLAINNIFNSIALNFQDTKNLISVTDLQQQLNALRTQVDTSNLINEFNVQSLQNYAILIAVLNKLLQQLNDIGILLKKINQGE